MFIETNLAAAAFDDAVPGDVAPFLAEVRRSLGSKDDKHVGQVIVAWDDVMVVCQSPDPTMYVVRRRAHVVSHARAVSEPVLSDGQLTLGQSFLTWISYRLAVRTERMNAILSDGAARLGDIAGQLLGWWMIARRCAACRSSSRSVIGPPLGEWTRCVHHVRQFYTIMS